MLLRIINAASFAPPTALSYLRHSCRSVNPAVRISASYLAKRTIEFATPESTNSLDSPFDAVLAVVNEFISPGPSVGATAAENALEELVVVLGLLKIFLVLPPHSILSPTQIYTQRQLAVLLPLVHVRSMDAEAIATLSTLLNDLLPSLLAQAASSTSPFYQQTRDALQTLSNRFQSSPVKVSTPRINLDEESFGPTPDLTVATFLINDLVSHSILCPLHAAEKCNGADETYDFEHWIRLDFRGRSSLLGAEAEDYRRCIERYASRTSCRSVLPRDTIGVDEWIEEWSYGFDGS